MGVEFVAPELVMKALEANSKIGKFGIRELERIIFEIFASSFSDLRDQKAKVAIFNVDPSGKIVCKAGAPPGPVLAYSPRPANFSAGRP